MNDRIEINMDGGVADVRLVRADKMNALDDAMFAALREAGEALKTRAGLRAVVLSGEGRAFCAGLDTANFGKMASGERGGARLLAGERTPGGANPPQHSVMVWREIPVPVIAAVHGVAYGGGFQLML
ncbi:MAG TPA: enoyl-CoA hydratase-related protein, partial [Rubrivivax sp.]|nr:enoyl-CoA hydratase-related protein [Rubrivivax sp.]